MSLQFAPQWVKPIKPTGTSTSTTTDSALGPGAPISKLSTAPLSSVPFPALSTTQRSASPATAHPNPVLSYSRATHTPQSLNFPDGAGYPFDTNGNDDPKLAFRYPREAMLGLWEEDKYAELPIELSQMLEEGGVLVSREVVKPVGLKERSEAEKKLLSSSVHPPAVTRRQPSTQVSGDQAANGAPNRRSMGPGATKEAGGLANGRTAFGGFGRGEGGALGGGAVGKFGAGPSERGAPAVGAEGRIPGVLGGGFGGVNRRVGPRKSTEEAAPPGADAPRASAPWRPTRTTSGSFEGVLGFGGPSQPSLSSSQSALLATPESSVMPRDDAWKPESPEKEKDDERFVGGGGPGWGSAPKKWRIAAGMAPTGERSLEVAHEDPSSISVRATPSATPLPERDAAIDTASVSTMEPEAMSMARESSGHGSASSQREEDLASIEWFYRDPNGQEQGPFVASQMHDWYSNGYFKDELPIRRSHETGYHTLSELKDQTGNAVTPFFAPIKPRRQPAYLPPTPLGPGGLIGSQTVESIRQLNISSPIHDPMNQSPMRPPQNYGFPDRNGPFSPNHFNGAPSPFQSVVSPMHQQQWGAPSPFGPNFGMQGMRPPQPPMHMNAPMPSRPDPFGASSPFGGAPGPWGAPGPAFPPMPQDHSPWNQQPPLHHPQPQPIYDAPRQPETPSEAPSAPSYFGHPQEQDAPISAEMVHEESFEFVEAPEDYVEEEEPTPEEPELPESAREEEPEPEVEAEKPAPPPSVWGQVPKPSVNDELSPAKTSLPSAPASAQLPPTPSTTTTAVTPSTASRLPPAPASLPPKPAAARSGSISEVAPPKPAPVEKTSLPPKPAPWAVSDDTPKAAAGASLREIQEAEAKRAEARKAALAEARAATSSPLGTPSEEVPSNITWGLLSSASGRGLPSSAPGASSTPPPAVWGSGDSGPKKTLKQIQEEEEKRAKKAATSTATPTSAAAATAKAVPGAAPVVKRGYADLAATSAPPGSGWTTVGAKAPVPGAAAPRPAGIPAKPVAPTSTSAKSSTPSTASASKVPSVNGTPKPPSSEDVGPSVEFIKWTKGALVGLSGNVDDFVQMLLSFPVDPPASSRADIAEIISDSVYGASSTLDGRRFASEFMSRRKADAARATTPAQGKAAKGVASLADVVKTVPKPPSAEAGFKVVKAKGKKKN